MSLLSAVLMYQRRGLHAVAWRSAHLDGCSANHSGRGEPPGRPASTLRARKTSCCCYWQTWILLAGSTVSKHAASGTCTVAPFEYPIQASRTGDYYCSCLLMKWNLMILCKVHRELNIQSTLCALQWMCCCFSDSTITSRFHDTKMLTAHEATQKKVQKIISCIPTVPTK